MRVVKADEKRKQAVHRLSCGYIRVKRSRYVICFYFLLQHKIGKVEYSTLKYNKQSRVMSAQPYRYRYRYTLLYFTLSLTVK